MATVNYIPYQRQSAVSLGKVAGYVSQDEKTQDRRTGRKLVSGVRCSSHFAVQEFRATRTAHHKKSPVWFYHYTQSFRTSKFSPFREANRKVNFCRFFKGSRRFSAVQKLSVHPPIVYAVLRKFTAFWRKLWRKFCAHIRGWPQPVQTPFRRTHSCCGCRHPR